MGSTNSIDSIGPFDSYCSKFGLEAIGYESEDWVGRLLSTTGMRDGKYSSRDLLRDAKVIEHGSNQISSGLMTVEITAG
jgi:hypothetical protein